MVQEDKQKSGVSGWRCAAGNFRAAFVATTGRRYSPSASDTLKYYRHSPLFCVDDVFDAIPFDCVPVAVDLIPGAIPLTAYSHPERAFYIFGAEDATLGRRILGRCRDVIVIPSHFCLNLAASVNVVLYDRMFKQAGAGKEGCDASAPEVSDLDGAGNGSTGSSDD